ncbi:hypothetical protein SAMN07250955_101112 [Arboricoccus pini]|uniref:N-acetyltransferase domain-containing protein n=1 Tax=Arboricoccus pini TaxID=1963835 RepID=A0A212PX39_9PROT|nr:GNAT family N-acetyltransferase [Arboricoccus pini]SNB51622.1 hypothetical protein SAMN07250955_101112 [Arboricoccus pini]
MTAPLSTPAIRPLTSLDHLEALAGLLVETVASGGSVNFMYPMAEADAREFWRGSLAAAARGERVVLGAFIDDQLVGTVTLMLSFPPNQPHRAEIAKLMILVAFRNRGIASALMRTAETIARERGKTLLVLDTAEEGGAAPLYARLGYVKAGAIPDFALKPKGGLTGTILF